MVYYLFVNNATFSWHATLSQIIAFSTTEAELMALAGCCYEMVWARKLALELGFPQLKPTDVYEDNTGCIALANNMPIRFLTGFFCLEVGAVGLFLGLRCRSSKDVFVKKHGKPPWHYQWSLFSCVIVGLSKAHLPPRAH